MRIRRSFGLGTLRWALAIAMVSLASPAYAQLGSLKGRIVDEAGKPVADAQLNLDYSGEVNYHFTLKTNQNGEWVRAGLYAVGGRWTVTARKGDMTGVLRDIEVPLAAVKVVPDIVIRGAAAAPLVNLSTPAAGGGNAKVSEAAAKEASELKKLSEEVNVALNAKNYDVAIAKLTEATTKVANCTTCYIWLGDSYRQKNDAANAEQAYKKAVELDPKSVQGYEALSLIYNENRKFEEAGKASAKAAELRAAAGGGGGDALSYFNAGVILSNQSKMAEAKVQFQKAIELDPKMAEAYYNYGMTLVNEGDMAGAKKALEEYLRLAPTGKNAAMAKELLPALK